MSKVFKFLMRFKFINLFIRLTKRIYIPGFEGLPLFDVSNFFYKGMKNGAINTRASSLAFKFFLALFPAIIFIFTMIAFIPVKGFQDELMRIIRDLLPDNAYTLASSTITDIIKHQRSGLLSITFLVSIYLSTNGINAIINAFNKSHHYIETRKPVQQYIVSLILVFAFAIMVIISISLVVFTEYILHEMVPRGWIKTKTIVFMVRTGRWIIIDR